LLKDSRLSITA